jgi:hypothetical protein
MSTVINWTTLEKLLGNIYFMTTRNKSNQDENVILIQCQIRKYNYYIIVDTKWLVI